MNQKIKGLIFCGLTLMMSKAQSAEFTPLLGAQVGYHHLNGQGSEINKKGYSLGVKGIGSFKFPDWFLDGAIGYQAEFLSANYIKIENYTPFAELSLRKTLGSKFSFGPMVQAQSGVYRTIPGVSENNKLLYSGGVQAVYRPESGPRFEVSVVKSFSGINDRNLYALRVGIQFPLGGKEKETSPPPKENVTVHAPAEVFAVIPTIVVPGFLSKKVYKNQNSSKFKDKLSGKTMGFEKKSHELDSESLLKIREVANFIVTNKMKMGRISISGHADELGTEEYNLTLSQARAQAVKDVFVEAGVDKYVEITTQGYSYNQPLMNSKAKGLVTKNRRTEIEFIDVVQNNVLVSKLKQIINK